MVEDDDEDVVDEDVFERMIIILASSVSVDVDDDDEDEVVSLFGATELVSLAAWLNCIGVNAIVAELFESSIESIKCRTRDEDDVCWWWWWLVGDWPLLFTRISWFSNFLEINQ